MEENKLREETWNKRPRKFQKILEYSLLFCLFSYVFSGGYFFFDNGENSCFPYIFDFIIFIVAIPIIYFRKSFQHSSKDFYLMTKTKWVVNICFLLIVDVCVDFIFRLAYLCSHSKGINVWVNGIVVTTAVLYMSALIYYGVLLGFEDIERSQLFKLFYIFRTDLTEVISGKIEINYLFESDSQNPNFIKALRRFWFSNLEDYVSINGKTRQKWVSRIRNMPRGYAYQLEFEAQSRVGKSAFGHHLSMMFGAFTIVFGILNTLFENKLLSTLFSAAGLNQLVLTIISMICIVIFFFILIQTDGIRHQEEITNRYILNLIKEAREN